MNMVSPFDGIICARIKSLWPALVVCFAVVIAASFYTNDAQALTATPSYQMQTAGSGAQECISCPFFVEMDRIKGVWSTTLFNAIAVQLNDILYTFVLLYFSWMALMFIAQPTKVGERVAKLPMTFLVIALVGISLSPTSMSYTDNSTSLVWYFLMGPLENSSLALGKLIVDISGARSTHLSGTDSHYAYLAASVEGQIWHITDLAGIIMFGEKGGILNILNSVPRIVAGLILLLPYLFVIGVFFAFLVEALFKYISITIVSPILVFSMIWTRMFAVAGARVVLGAALTIVFASGAMSLTVEVISVQGDVIKSKVADADQRKTDLLTQHDSIGCRVGVGGQGRDPKFDQMTPQEFSEYCRNLRNKADNADSITVFQREYFMLVIIGFVSILLHLGSKALASNISGANDGAGPAAATVAAAKMALGAGFMYGSRGLFGAGGPMGTMRDTLMGAGRGGQSLYQGGVMGAPFHAAGATARRVFSGSHGGTGGGGGGGSAANPFAQAAQAAAGGSGLSDKTAQQLTQAIKGLSQNFKAAGGQPGGGGKDRYS